MTSFKNLILALFQVTGTVTFTQFVDRFQTKKRLENSQQCSRACSPTTGLRAANKQWKLCISNFCYFIPELPFFFHFKCPKLEMPGRSHSQMRKTYLKFWGFIINTLMCTKITIIHKYNHSSQWELLHVLHEYIQRLHLFSVIPKQGLCKKYLNKSIKVLPLPPGCMFCQCPPSCCTASSTCGF